MRFWRAASRISPSVPIGAAAIIYAAFGVLTLPSSPILEADSYGYLGFSPARTSGYPLFLWALGPMAAEILQPILYALSAAILCSQFPAIIAGRRNLYAAIAALMVLLFANPEVNAFHAKILTESLFCALLMIALACSLRYAVFTDAKSILIASIFAGMSYTVRPTGIVLLPALIMLVLMRRKGGANLSRALLAAILPMLAIVAVEQGYSRWLHGTAGLSSLAGPQFFGKASVIDAPEPDRPPANPVDREFAIAMEHDFQPIRTLLAEAPNADIRTPLTVYYENCITNACSGDLRANILRMNVGLSDAAMNAAELRAGLARIARAPLSYADLVWTDYRALWTLYSQSHPGLAGPFNAFLDEHRPLPFGEYVSDLGAKRTSRAAIVIRPAFRIVGLMTGFMAILAIALALRGTASPLMAISCFAALVAHGGALFSAIFSEGVPRYILGLWPAIVTALVCGAMLMVEGWRRSRPFSRKTVRPPPKSG